MSEAPWATVEKKNKTEKNKQLINPQSENSQMSDLLFRPAYKNKESTNYQRSNFVPRETQNNNYSPKSSGCVPKGNNYNNEKRITEGYPNNRNNNSPKNFSNNGLNNHNQQRLQNSTDVTANANGHTNGHSSGHANGNGRGAKSYMPKKNGGYTVKQEGGKPKRNENDPWFRGNTLSSIKDFASEEEKIKFTELQSEIPHLVMPGDARRKEIVERIEDFSKRILDDECIEKQREGWKFVKVMRPDDHEEPPDGGDILELGNKYGDILLFEMANTCEKEETDK